MLHLKFSRVPYLKSAPHHTHHIIITHLSYYSERGNHLGTEILQRLPQAIQMEAGQSPPTIDPHTHEGYKVTSSLGEGRSYILVLKHAEIITLLLIRLCSAMTLRIRDER